MPVARDQLSTAMLDDCECPEAIHLQFVNPIGIIEGSGPLQQRHGLELKTHHCFQNSRSTRPPFRTQCTSLLQLKAFGLLVIIA